MLLQRGYDMTLFGQRAIPLIRPGWISPRMSFARAQTGGAMATTLGADDATWSEVAADVPRYYGSARRLRVEGQRTNLIANARTVGGTGWALNQTGVPVATSGPDGAAASGLRIAENTATSSHQATGPNVSFTSGQSYVFSALLRAGTCGTVQLLFTSATHGANAYANFDLQGGAKGTAGSAITRHEIRGPYGGWYVCEIAAPATVTTTNAAGAVVFTTSSSASRLPSYTGTSRYLDMSWAWLEAASFASTPILPAVGTPAASTRGADLLSAPLNGARRGVVLWSGLWGQNAPSALDQMALQVDDGTDANRFRVRNAGGGATVVAGRVASSASADLPSLGNMTAGALTSLGLAFDLDTGAYKAMLRGGTLQSGTGGPQSGTALRVGNNVASTAAQFGDVRDLDFIPGVYPSDAEMAARVNAMSLT